MVLKLEGLTKYYNIKKIFEDIDFFINEGDRIGIIGVNGVGKSTLLNIISGVDKEYEGSMYWKDSNISTFYGTQELLFSPEASALDFVMQSCKIDALNLESKGMLLKLLKELGFLENDLHKKCSELSGGMQTKLILAAAMHLKPQLLILDEPNNHLDMEQLKLLEDFLGSYKGTLVMVTHDRKLLNNVCNKIIEISSEGSKTYNGSYSNYVIQKEIELKEQQTKYENYTREKNSLIKNIQQRREWFTAAHKAAGQNDFLRAKSKKQAKVMKAKERALEKLERNKVKKPMNVQTVNLSFLGPTSEAGILARVEGVCKSYGNHRVLQDINFIIRNKERYCLLGENGSGKTTLLNIISGVDTDYLGHIKLNPSASIAYYRQLHENLNMDKDILEEIRETGVSANEARLLLGSFLIRGNEVFKKINQLSIGERSRVSILKTILGKADLLILDEPTNHMDIYTREVFEDALLQFDGAILFVSHDRYFIEKITTKILKLEKNKLIEYPGDYSYYIEKSQNDNTINTNSENKMLLEIKLAYVNGKLEDPKLSQEQKDELKLQYFSICRELRGYSKI